MDNFRCGDCDKFIRRENWGDFWDYPVCEKCQEKVTRSDQGEFIKEKDD